MSLNSTRLFESGGYVAQRQSITFAKHCHAAFVLNGHFQPMCLGKWRKVFVLGPFTRPRQRWSRQRNSAEGYRFSASMSLGKQKPIGYVGFHTVFSPARSAQSPHLRHQPQHTGANNCRPAELRKKTEPASMPQSCASTRTRRTVPAPPQHIVASGQRLGNDHAIGNKSGSPVPCHPNMNFASRC